MIDDKTPIDEPTLTLYYYDDGLSDSERRHVAQAIGEDELLAARYATLCSELDDLGDQQDVPAPEHLKHQWHALIEQESRLERQTESANQSTAKKPFHFLKLGGVLASVLVAGIVIGTLLVQKQPDPIPGLVAVDDTLALATPVAFQRGVAVYLQDSQGELAHIDEVSPDMQALLLMQIVAQNRLFERAAESNNAPEIARLMRAFEPILLRLAAQETTPQDAEALRKQLSFELKAMLTKIQQSTSEQAQTI